MIPYDGSETPPERRVVQVIGSRAEYGVMRSLLGMPEGIPGLIHLL